MGARLVNYWHAALYGFASHGARLDDFLAASGGVDCGERRVREAAFYLLVLRRHGLSVICEDGRHDNRDMSWQASLHVFVSVSVSYYGWHGESVFARSKQCMT